MRTKTLALGAVVLALLLGALWFFFGRSAPTPPAEDNSPTAAEKRAAIAAKKRTAREENDVDRAPVRLTGRVAARKDDSPISGALVLLTPKSFEGGVSRPGERSKPLFARTDAGGGWTLEGVPPGRYTLSASATGYLSAAQRKIAIKPGSEPKPIHLALESGGLEVDGTVEDVSGGPIEGALVSVTRLDDGNILSFDRAPSGVLTNEDGHFSLTLKAGTYIAAVSQDDYLSVTKSFELIDARTLEIQMTPGAVVEGVVRVRGSEDPVAGAVVIGTAAAQSSSAGGFNVRGFGEHRVVTDGEGHFRLSGLPSGIVELTAVADGYATKETREVSLGIAQTESDVDVWVEPAFSIRGFVVPKGSEEDEGLEGVWVGALSLRPPGLFVARRPSEEDGFFEIHGVDPGTYMVAALGEEALPNLTGTSAEVVDADVDDVLVVMNPGVSIKGRVEPPGPATVALEIAPEGMGMTGMLSGMANAFVRTRADAEGNFELHPVAPGKLSVVAEADDGSKGKVELEVGAEGVDDLVVTLEPKVSIKGTVVSANGEPVGDVKVKATRIDVEPKAFTMSFSVDDNPMFGGGTPTHEDGTFEIKGLEPGEYEVSVSAGQGPSLAWADKPKEGAATDPMQLSVPDQGLDGVQLRVETRDGVIEGVVLDADGAPVADAWVRASLEGSGGRWLSELRRAQKRGQGKQIEARMQDETDDKEAVGAEALGSLAATKPSLTDARGRFRIADLRAGQYTITAEAEGGQSRVSEKGVEPGDDIKLEVEPLGSLEGRVTVGTKTVAKYTLSLQGPTARSKMIANDKGVYSVDGLDPGEYTVSIECDDGVGSTTVEVERGERGTADVELEEFGTVRGKVVSSAGEPLAGLMILVQPKGKPVGAAGGLEMLFGGGPKTDRSGAFEVDDVPPGEGEILIVDPDGSGGGGANAKYEVDAGGTADVGTVTSIAAGDVPFPERGDLGLRTAVRDWPHRPLPPTDGEDDGEADARPPEDPERERLWIRSVAEDGAAFEAGIRPGDEIVSIGGQDVAGLGAKTAAAKLGASRVRVGENVALVLEREGSSVRATLTARKRNLGGAG